MNLLNLFEKFLRRIQSEGNELFQGHKICDLLEMIKKEKERNNENIDR
jgi:hypothetical protein